MGHRIGYTASDQYRCIEDLRRDYVDLYLSYSGCEDCLPGFGFGPEIRTEYVIHVITKGKGIFQSGGKTWHLEAGDSFLIYPDVVTYYEADKDDPWSYIWVGFNGVRAEECIRNIHFTQEQPVTHFTCVDKLYQCIDTLLNSHQLTYFNELKRISCMFEFFSIMAEDHQQNSDMSASHDYSSADYVEYAINYMRRHYHHKIKIQELADFIGINRSYLTNNFKKQLNTSPQEFLLNLRMEKASCLLQTTDLPVSSVASRVGYDDSLAFSKIFKQKFGISPKAYREGDASLVTVHHKGGYEMDQTL